MNLIRKLPVLFIALFTASFALSAQQSGGISGQVTGVVVDDQGVPCIGASVVVKGTDQYSITDLDGKFVLKAQPGKYTLTVNCLGFLDTVEEFSPSQNDLRIVMRTDTKTLDEVVVVGYGSQRKELLTNAITKFKPDEDNLKQALSPSELLQGHVAGMTVSTQSGNLGSAERVSIRGSASLSASNEPLYVIDGIPLNNDSGSLYSYGEDLSSMSVLNLTDIESIEVLKDAASAAIYGSRATNGVILITTKSGKEGKSDTKINYNTGVNTFPSPNRVKYATSEQWFQVYNTAISNYNNQMGYHPGDASYVLPLQNPYSGLADTNWLDAVTQAGVFHNVDLSFSGGNAKTNFYIGASYRHEDGIIKTNSIDKINLKANVSHKMTNWLAVGANLSGNYIKNNRVPGANLGSSVIARAVEQRPFDTIYTPEGGYYQVDQFSGTGLHRHNPAMLLSEAKSYVDNYRFLGAIYATVTIAKKVDVKFSYSTDVGYTYDYLYYTANHVAYGINDDRQGRIVEKNRLAWTNLYELVANYNDKWGDFSFNAMLGHSFQKTSFHSDSMDVQDFPSPSYDTVGSSAYYAGVTGGIGEYSIESYFGRVGFSYKDRYVLNATLRADGSSRFAPAHRWGYFPSVSVGWNLSNEQWWNDKRHDLKVRASYGKTGNQDGISNYGWQPLISAGSNYDQKSGIAASSNGNPDLTWETADQFDVGFDLNLWKGKLGIIVDGYLKNTNNLLYSKPTASTTGFTSIMSNIGSMRNYGIELTIDGHLDLGPVLWDSSFNITHNRNKLTGLLNDDIISLNSYHALKVGAEVGAFYLYQFDGIYQYDGEVPQQQYDLGVRAGDANFHDFNGDGLINTDDRVLCGSANPIFTGGWNNTFKYKGFDLGVFMTFSYGAKVFAAWMQGATSLGNYQGALREWAGHYWTGPGSTNSYPRPVINLYGNNNKASTYFLKDASYLRLSTVTFGYTFPSKWMDTIHLKSLRLYFSGENLAIGSSYPGWDPEVSTSSDPALIGVDNYGVPRSRVYKFGINIKF